MEHVEEPLRGIWRGREREKKGGFQPLRLFPTPGTVRTATEKMKIGIVCCTWCCFGAVSFPLFDAHPLGVRFGVGSSQR